MGNSVKKEIRRMKCFLVPYPYQGRAFWTIPGAGGGLVGTQVHNFPNCNAGSYIFYTKVRINAFFHFCRKKSEKYYQISIVYTTIGGFWRTIGHFFKTIETYSIFIVLSLFVFNSIRIGQKHVLEKF